MSGHGRNVLIDPAGSVVEVEEEVALAALPGPVQEGVRKVTAGGKMVKLESITKNNTVAAYEVTVKRPPRPAKSKYRPTAK